MEQPKTKPKPRKSAGRKKKPVVDEKYRDMSELWQKLYMQMEQKLNKTK